MWHNPLPSMSLFPSPGSEDYKEFLPGESGVPIGDQHPGAFGFKRKNHTHEGVDLYCPEGTEVVAVEEGIVVAIIPFTGSQAEPSSPWWEDTQAVLIEGDTGVVVYGEIIAKDGLWVGDLILQGQTVGHVKRVLREDKGRPMSMLHLELHQHGTKDAYEWLDERPASLLDPTGHLLLSLTYVGRPSPSDGL